MMHAATRPQRCGFARSDALATLALVAIAAALALAASRHVRQESRTASALSQLQWIASATGSYAADNADRYWNFSWTVATTPPTYPVPSSDYIAQGYQAVDILRRRGRPDMPTISGWIPHPGYSHLTLIDYLDRDIPDFNFVSPGDTNRLAWARDPAAFDAGAFLPLQPQPGSVNKRWPYSSSFEQPPAFYDRGEQPFQRIYQGTAQSFYIIPPDVTLSAWRISDVAYPSQKAHIYDTAERDNAEEYFFLDDFHNATVPMALADGSTGTRAAGDSNGGWHPAQPTSAAGLVFRYQPNPWDPQGTGGITMYGRYRWTRGGIAGRDFGGPEVDTGQP